MGWNTGAIEELFEKKKEKKKLFERLPVID